MKKNKFLKLASGLLVLCLLTTCVISTTFAKYVTSDSASDSARVAKWGVTVGVKVGDSTETDAFYKEYSKDAKVTVKSNDKVVAPGTEGTLASFSINGTPEVALNLNVAITNTAENADQVDVFLKAADDKYLDWTTGKADDKFNLAETYYPVEYTLYKDNVAVDTSGNTLAKVVKYLEDLSKDYYILDNTADANAWDALLGEYRIDWKWDYDQAAPNVGQNDQADTLLGNIGVGGEFAKDAAGNALAAGTDYSLTIDFALAITVTQID